MNVKELKELLKNAPDDMEIVLGASDEFYGSNMFFKLDGIDKVKLIAPKFKSDFLLCYHKLIDEKSEKTFLLFYNKFQIELDELQQHIVKP